MFRAPLLVVVLLSCKGEPAEPPVTTDPSECPPDSTVTWENFGDPFVHTWCTACHSETLHGEARQGAPDGVDFDHYEDVAVYADRILLLASGDPPSMPPAGGTTDEERSLLVEWILCDTPGSPTEPASCDLRVGAAGDQTLASQAEADALCAEANAVEGGLVVTGSVAVDCLCEVSGDLDLSGATGFEAPALSAIGGSLAILDGGPGLIALPALASVARTERNSPEKSSAAEAGIFTPLGSAGLSACSASTATQGVLARAAEQSFEVKRMGQ